MISDTEALQVAYWAGPAVALLLAFAGLLKCYQVARRPTANGKCLVALMLVLVTVVLTLSLGIPAALIKSDAASAVLRLAQAAVVMVLPLAAIVVGILGLLECQDRRSRYKQGAAQATLALVLAGLMLTGALAIGARGFSLPWESLAKGKPLGTAGPPLVFDEGNFKFLTPGEPWSLAHTNLTDTRLRLEFSRSSPSMGLFVVAEKLGPGFDSEQLAQVARAKLRKGFGAEQVLTEEPEGLNGLQGLLVESRAISNRTDNLWVQWYCVTNGYGYQLVAHGPWRSRQQVSSDARKLFAQFESLDLERTTGPGGVRFPTNFVSGSYGYSVEVANSPWHQWQALQREFGWFEFSARQDSGLYLAVVPVWLNQDLGPEALQRAMLWTMGVSYPDPALTDRKTFRVSGIDGIQFNYERYVYDIPYQYRIWILSRGGFAWLACTWAEQHRKATEADFEAALGRVTFEPERLVPPNLEKLSPRERVSRALVLNEAGMYYHEHKQDIQARRLFAAAYESHPEPLYFENTVNAWLRVDEPQEALAFVEKQANSNPKNIPLQAYLALFQGRAGKHADAAATYEKLFGEGPKRPDWFEGYVDQLLELRRFDDALTAIRKELSQKEEVRLRLLEASVFRKRGTPADAITALKALREKMPFVPEVAGALVGAQLEAGEYKDARALCVELLASAGPAWELHFLKGQSEAGMKDYEAAKASFEEALRLAPAEAQVKKALDLVSGMTGEGDNTALKEPIAPVAIPSSLLDGPLPPLPADYGKDYGAYYSRRITALRYEKDGTLRTTEYARLHILDSAGANNFSTIEMPFDPLAEQIYVNMVRVTEAGGNVVTGRLARLYVTDDQTTGLATHGKILNIPVSGLAPGVTLELMVTRSSQSEVQEPSFQLFYFSRGCPVRQAAVFVSGEIANVKYESCPMLEPRKLPEGLCWLFADPPVIRLEPLQAPPHEFLPTVWLGQSATGWDKLARSYLAEISDRLVLDEPLRKQVELLTAGLKTDAEKIMMLARYVQTNFTYKALEFGSRARIPDLPTEMARNRYGDCKDHSVMLQQMLQEAGIMARLALVNSGGSIRTNLPSMEQFNHMILYLPGRGADAFIDCTQKGALLGKGPPHGLDGELALILDQSRPRFVQIPGLAGPGSTLRSDRRVVVTKEGNVNVEEVLELSGVLAASFREELMSIPADRRRLFLQSYFSAAKAELSDFVIQDLENPAAPLRFQLGYALRQQFHSLEDRLVGTVPAVFEREYLLSDPIERRLSPFRVRYPLQFTSKIRVVAPEGFRSALYDESERAFETPFLTVKTSRPGPGPVEYEFTCTQKAGTFPVEQYKDFRDAASQALTLVERRLAFEPAPPK